MICTNLVAQNELLSPPRAIQTLEELLLLLAIYKHQGYVREALAVLDSSNLGILSTVGKSNWSLVREKLDLLEEAGMWQEEWDYCRTLLENAQPRNKKDGTEHNLDALASQGDDWRLWTGLIVSSQEIATSASVSLRLLCVARTDTSRFQEPASNGGRNIRIHQTRA